MFDKLGFVDLVGNLGDDDGIAFPFRTLDTGTSADPDNPAAGFVGGVDVVGPVDDSPCWEIWPGDMLHQLTGVDVRVVYQLDRCVTHLSEIMRRDIRRHAYSDSRGAVYQQIREFGRQNDRFF